MNGKASVKPETNEKNWIEISDPSRLPAKPLVSVFMLTYNHAPYLAEAIEGVLMQQTDFQIELLIGEDCSLDNSREIALRYQRDYPHITRIITARHNVGVIKNWERLLAECKGTFLAICEGDDYWVDALKLQKQVDFLQKNEDYGLCYTEIDRLNVATNSLEKDTFKNIFGLQPNTFSYFLINAPFLATCTWIFKVDMAKSIKIYLKGPGDTQLLLTISSQSKVKFINESTAVYRILEESASHHKSTVEWHSFRKDVLNIQCHYASKYNEDYKAEIFLKYYLTSFLHICQNDSKIEVDEAYFFLKKENKVNIKIYLYYWLTTYKMLPIALWLKKTLKFSTNIYEALAKPMKASGISGLNSQKRKPCPQVIK